MTSNPSQAAFPLLNTQFVDQNGFLSIPWYAFLSSLHVKTGSSIPASNAASLSFSGTELVAYASNGSPIGPIAFTSTAKQPAEVLSPATSPFYFRAPNNGFLTVGVGGAVTFSRDGVTYYPVLAAGGQLVMLAGDACQVTWSGAPPSVVWFGGNT